MLFKPFNKRNHIGNKRHNSLVTFHCAASRTHDLNQSLWHHDSSHELLLRTSHCATPSVTMSHLSSTYTSPYLSQQSSPLSMLNFKLPQKVLRLIMHDPMHVGPVWTCSSISSTSKTKLEDHIGNKFQCKCARPGHRR